MLCTSNMATIQRNHRPSNLIMYVILKILNVLAWWNIERYAALLSPAQKHSHTHTHTHMQCKHTFPALLLLSHACNEKHWNTNTRTLHLTAASLIASIQHLGMYCRGPSQNSSACFSFKKTKRKWAETPVSPLRVRCAAHFKVKGSRECGTNEASGVPIQTSTSR